MLSKPYSLIYAVIIAFSLNIGCQKSGNSNAAPEVVPQAQGKTTPDTHEVISPSGVAISIKKKTELREDRSNYEEFKESLNQYKTSIVIPEDLFDADLEIKRSLAALAVVPSYQTLKNTDLRFEDGVYKFSETLSLWQNDLSRKNITYKIYSHNQLVAELQATLVPDLVVPKNEKGVVTLQDLGIVSGNLEFDTVFFEPGSRLRTEGASIQFSMERLYAVDATLETYSEEFAAMDPGIRVAGKNGGRIEMNVAQAMGSLQIFMRGTNGGQGSAAEPQTGVGASGQPGSNGRVIRTCDPGVLSVPEKDATWSQSEPLFFRNCYFSCEQSATRGGDGGQGPKGNDGGQGMAGGSTGELILIVKKQNPAFTAYVQTRVGLGGVGGEPSAGGAGGSGGPGGAGGRDICPSAPNGNQGPAGPAGERGVAGLDGNLESTVIRIENVNN